MSIAQRSTVSLALLIAATVPVQADPPQDPASAPGWRPLFDGRSLNGWEHVGPGKFVVEDGALKTDDGMGLLWYAGEKLGNCVIRVVYKTGTERSNSGVYIRIADRPKDPWFAVHHGFEIQIMDSGREAGRTGAIYTFAKANAQPAKPGQWNTLEITLKGKQISTTLNNVQISEFDSSGLVPPAVEKTGEGDPDRGPRPESGYIGLQNHDKNSVVYFKEVSVRPLASGAP
jgi:3-keto-disaccharide hydrolase